MGIAHRSAATILAEFCSIGTPPHARYSMPVDQKRRATRWRAPVLKAHCLKILLPFVPVMRIEISSRGPILWETT